jgi:hypothetical protein
MQIKFGQRLKDDPAASAAVDQVKPILEEEFGRLATATVSIELAFGFRNRPIFHLSLQDFGHTTGTGFAQDEILPSDHFRSRCHRLLGEHLQSDRINDCPKCGHNYRGQPLPFNCVKCGFQTVQDCPSCHAHQSISEYATITPELWQCPNCQVRVRARYADPMTDEHGRFAEPLVLLKLA